MDKKKIIIIVAALVILVLLYLTNKDKSYSDMMDSLEGTIAGKTGKDAQESMSAVKLSAEDTAYNVARQKFYSSAGKYPPTSWTIEQINEATNNWSQIRSQLTMYAQYMGKMDRLDEAKREAANCFDIATAERLASGAKEEYTAYQQKQKVYNELVNVCNRYGISAADLGIKNFAKDNITSISNALTRANQLGGLKSRYNELNKLCQTAGVQISKYIGYNKWYDVFSSAYDSAIATVKKLYLAAVQSAAKDVVLALCYRLNPYQYDGETDPVAKTVLHCPGSLASFRDRPHENRWALEPELFQEAINFCAKSDDHLKAFKQEFMDAKLRYPTYRCQAEKYWSTFSTLSGFMISAIAHSGGASHLTGRDNWEHVEVLYNQKKAPLV